jgi:hypothetical protein
MRRMETRRIRVVIIVRIESILETRRETLTIIAMTTIINNNNHSNATRGRIRRLTLARTPKRYLLGSHVDMTKDMEVETFDVMILLGIVTVANEKT